MLSQTHHQVIDADGTLAKTHQKTPTSEATKSTGATGSRVFQTAVGVNGLGLGADQWYPEAARAMVLQGLSTQPNLYGCMCRHVYIIYMCDVVWCGVAWCAEN